MEVIVTGGCGFVGHHLVEHLLKNTDWDIKIFDKLTYASNGFDRLRDIRCYPDEQDRVQVFSVDISQPVPLGIYKECRNAQIIFHLAAESHVDNSILDPIPFVQANVLGTAHMLNFARELSCLDKFLYFGTDEVFGPAPPYVYYKEDDRYNSTNPYSATKAGGEELAVAYANTYKLPVIITHTMNCFGERQHPEKYIPMCIKKIMNKDVIKVHSSPKGIPGQRHYIHCRNVADAILFLIRNDELGKFNIVGEKEVDNLQLAKLIGKHLNMEVTAELVDFHSSRPGHDLRYALDGEKLALSGWRPPKMFELTLKKVIDWYVNNPEWLGR